MGARRPPGEQGVLEVCGLFGVCRRGSSLAFCLAGPGRGAAFRGQGMLVHSSLDEVPEQGMGLHGPGLEFGMELAAQEPGMILKLHDFHQGVVGRHAAVDKALLGQQILEGIVELVAVV